MNESIRRIGKPGRLVTLGSALALGMLGCASHPAASSGPAVTGVPSSAIPMNGHPNLKGMSVTFADQGSPDPSRILNYHMITLLKSWGANAKMDWTQSEQIASAAISSGQAQVIMGTIPNQLPAVESGFAVKAFGINEPRVDYAFVTVSSITSISQLRGKSVGVLSGGGGDISYVLAAQALAAGGLKPSDVHIVKTGGQTARIAALASGLIQASVVGHESLYELKSLGVHNLFDFTAKDPQLYNDLLWAPPSWLKANPKMAVAIDLAALDTYKWFTDKANAQAAINEGMADSQGATLATTTALYGLLRHANVYNPGTTITTAGLTYQQQYYVKAGTLPSAEPITDWSTTIYDAAALEAYNASSKK